MRTVYQAMLRHVDGGKESAAALLGMSESSLDNRLYERKGQSIDVDMALQLQVVSNTTLFAEAVAKASAGVFFSLPAIDDSLGNEELLAKFSALLADVGQLAHRHKRAIEDGFVDATERRELDDIANGIHRRLQEFLGQTYRVFAAPIEPVVSVATTLRAASKP